MAERQGRFAVGRVMGDSRGRFAAGWLNSPQPGTNRAQA
jgi:hypothetical protein